MAWKPEVKTVGSNTWGRNALCFATEKEAVDWAFDLMLRWSAVTDYGAGEVDEPATHRLVEGENKVWHLETIKEEQS